MSMFDTLTITPHNGVGEEEQASYLDLVGSGAYSPEEQFATLLPMFVDKRVIEQFDLQEICCDCQRFKYHHIHQI